MNGESLYSKLCQIICLVAIHSEYCLLYILLKEKTFMYETKNSEKINGKCTAKWSTYNLIIKKDAILKKYFTSFSN